ncbi:MAG: hypothetical protein WC325_02135 [Candidatus Bathyarchaeia archaeon]
MSKLRSVDFNTKIVLTLMVVAVSFLALYWVLYEIFQKKGRFQQ